MDNFNILLFRCQIWIIVNILILTSVVNSNEDANAEIVEYINENDGDGNYHFKFLTSNGITREETGTLEGIDRHPVVQGSYSYQTPEGKLVTVFYVADENGYKILPEGPKDTGIKMPDIHLAPVAVKGMARLLFAAVIFYMTVSPTIGFAQLTRFVNNNNGYGKYSFEYETSDGTYRKEDGGLVQGPEGDTFVVRGEYGYIDPEGRHYVVHYVADTNGYRPQQFDDNTRFNDRRIL